MIVFVIALCLSWSITQAGPAWEQIGINTWTAQGAYGRVKEAYSHVLIFEQLLLAFHKVSKNVFVLIVHMYLKLFFGKVKIYLIALLKYTARLKLD